MIKVQNLTKHCEEFLILDGISFESKGILGLIPSSQQEKNSFLNIIGGLSTDFSGTVIINSSDISENSLEHKRKVGYLSDSTPVYTDMTSEEFLLFIGKAKKIPYEKLYRQTKEALDLVLLANKKDILASFLSKEEQKMLGLAGALIGNPSVIILDGIFSDLSAETLNNVKSIIKMLGEIKNVVITSSDPKYLLELSNNILMISDGKATLYEDLELVKETLSGNNSSQIEDVSSSLKGNVCTEEEAE